MSDETTSLILEQLRIIRSEIADVHATLRTQGKRLERIEGHLRSLHADVGELRADDRALTARVLALESQE